LDDKNRDVIYYVWYILICYRYLAADTEMTRSSADVRVKSQIIVQPMSRGLPNRAGGDTRGKDESSPKKPRIQLYKPPAMKEKGMALVQCLVCCHGSLDTDDSSRSSRLGET